jgi:transcriptional regulator with XRE-family HTH domain
MKLARLAGITPSALSQIESGDVQPSLATLRRLARALGLSLELVERKGVV